MTLCRTHRIKDPFVRLSKSIVFDNSISLKAKGLLSIAFSRPEDWTFYRKEMLKHSCDGETSFDSGIKELERAGYLHRSTKHAKDGRIQGWEWHFFEEPISAEEFKKFHRNGGNPCDGETPVTGKRQPTKKDLESKKEKEIDDDERARETSQKKKEPKTDPILMDKLAGIVGTQNAQTLIMQASRTNYDLGHVTEYVIKNLKNIREPVRVVSAAIRDQADYSDALKNDSKAPTRSKRISGESKDVDRSDTSLEGKYDDLCKFFQIDQEDGLEPELKKVFRDLLEFETPNEIKNRYKQDFITKWAKKIKLSQK